MAEDVKMAYMGEVGSEEFLMKLTTQITEMVSAKMTQGEERLVLQKKQKNYKSAFNKICCASVWDQNTFELDS